MRRIQRAPFKLAGGLCTLATLVGASLPSSAAQAQALAASEQFQDLFATAGYSALFGAALGTAVLPFLPDGSVSGLRIVAGGASLGFVAGSVMALYSLRQSQQAQAYMYSYPSTEQGSAAGEGSDWRWDVGTSTGKDVFLRMDSRF